MVQSSVHPWPTTSATAHCCTFSRDQVRPSFALVISLPSFPFHCCKSSPLLLGSRVMALDRPPMTNTKCCPLGFMFLSLPILRGHPAPRVTVGLEMASPSQGALPPRLRVPSLQPPHRWELTASREGGELRCLLALQRLMGHWGPKEALRVWGGTVSRGRDL